MCEADWQDFAGLGARGSSGAICESIVTGGRVPADTETRPSVSATYDYAESTNYKMRQARQGDALPGGNAPSSQIVWLPTSAPSRRLTPPTVSAASADEGDEKATQCRSDFDTGSQFDSEGARKVYVGTVHVVDVVWVTERCKVRRGCIE